MKRKIEFLWFIIGFAAGYLVLWITETIYAGSNYAPFLMVGLLFTGLFLRGKTGSFMIGFDLVFILYSVNQIKVIL